MSTVLLVILVLLLVGAFPAWPHNREWGPAPASLAWVILVVLLVLLLTGHGCKEPDEIERVVGAGCVTMRSLGMLVITALFVSVSILEKLAAADELDVTVDSTKPLAETGSRFEMTSEVAELNFRTCSWWIDEKERPDYRIPPSVCLWIQRQED